MTRPQPAQQAPPQQRLRVRYAKRGRARFASHRDIGRAIERALRRADIPMAYSSGFSPHPRVSYAGASPTGAASESEYLELGLAQPLDPDLVREQLNRALPDGIVVVGVLEVDKGALADLLTTSCWRLDVPGVTAATADLAVAALLARPEHQVERMTKSGLRSFDVRAAILRLRVDGEGLLELVSAIGSPLVRPDDVVTALTEVHQGFRPSQPPVFTRLAQGVFDGDRVVDPVPAQQSER
ncbi:MAG: TIGR03936 family radical SAM-associated protein [Propionicimonas sp.]|nr:TIGR03936 family radical SAM-associated protein [Propionicimonas sp.]